MSLIYSALEEIDKRAHGSRVETPPAEAPTVALGRRRGTVFVVAVLVVLFAVAAYLVLKPKPVAPATATVPAAAVVRKSDSSKSAAAQPSPTRMPDATTVARIPAATARPAEVAAASPTAHQANEDVPYAPSPAAVTIARSGDGRPLVRIVRHEPAIAGSEEGATTAPSVHAAVGPAAAPQTAVAESTPAASAMPATAEHAEAVAAQAPASVPRTRRSTSARASKDDAPTIGSNNYIKVGKVSAAGDDRGVAHWVDEFNADMRGGNHAKALKALARLKAGLSPESMTLLRMEAWYAVDTGDNATARDLYARILARLPDDVTAGVNAAAIDWRTGQHQAAENRIDQLHIEHPDSALVTRYWRVMHGVNE